jgi:hypothetical protein
MEGIEEFCPTAVSMQYLIDFKVSLAFFFGEESSLFKNFSFIIIYSTFYFFVYKANLFF